MKRGNNVKKKILAALISVCLAALPLAGCGNNVDDASGISRVEQPSESTTTTTTSETTTTTSETAAEASGSLVTSQTTSQSSETTTTTTTTTSEETTTTTTTSQTSAATTTKATTKASAPAPSVTSTKATTKPAQTKPAPTTTKAPAASSANVKFYQDRVYVAGDSVAYGFCAYGYIPYEHNIAQGSLAMRNYTSYGWFDVNGRSMRCMDAIAVKQPRLLYVSMGMNDINITSAQTYASNYVGFLKQVRAKVPNCIIVAANITPTGVARQTYSSLGPAFTVTNIRNCNAAMINAVKAMNDPNVILFDAYSVVSAGGVYMASGYGAGDQLHLAGHVYQKLLNRLAVVLDQYGVKERLS